ncbi:MAG: hypothetical protein IPK26_16155 [Planctomycetes bacterium]|nr:hypothetical protein [Planctomycetota bacterium]
MRATLEKLPGVKGAEITAGNAEITVHNDPATTNVDKVLEGMAAGGQPAQKK